jgi:protein O-mannosyl-transferase
MASPASGEILRARPPTGKLIKMPRWRIGLAGVALLLAGLAVYANSLNAPFVFDDRNAIQDNPTIRHLGNLAEIFSPPRDHVSGAMARPLVNASLALNYALGGLNPWGYHLLNLLLHLLSALTLFGLARRTLLRPVLSARFGAAALPLAFSVALVWTVHPLLTETITCVIQRTEGLMSLFYLLTLYTFARSMDSLRPWPWQIASVLACLLGMISKEVMISAPLLVLLYDRTFVAGTFRQAWRLRWKFYAALACAGVPLAVLVLSVGQRLDTAGFGLTMPWWAYALKECQAVTAYLGLSFWPHPLILDYGADVVTSPLTVAPQILLLTLLLAGTVYALSRRRALGFVGAFFFAILAPSSSVMPLTTQTMAEHRMYLPLAAVVAVTVLVVYACAGRRSLFLWPVLALALGGVTLARNQDYQSALSLWRDTVQNRPDNPRAYDEFGTACVAAGLPALALPEFLSALRLDPDYAEARTELGNLYQSANQPAKAIAEYNLALQSHPNYARAHNNLGLAYETINQPDQALAEFSRALKIDPNYLSAHNNLGLAYQLANQPEKAVTEFNLALKIDPDNAPAHYNLGLSLFQLQRYAEAARQFEAALKLNPNLPNLRDNLEKARQLAQSPTTSLTGTK